MIRESACLGMENLRKVASQGATRPTGSRFVTAGTVLFAVCLSGPVGAESLKDAVGLLIKDHKRIVAAQNDVDAAKERLQASRGGWYPTLDVTASYGYEDQNKGNGTADTAMPPRAVDMSLTQLIYDFGKTNAGIDRTRIEVQQAMETLRSTRQNLILEGINAYFDVIRQRRLMEYNNGSLDNVKRQMQLEDSKVQRGSGLATDVLQAKTQLAGLEATRTRLSGALRTAVNRYVAVFGVKPPSASETRMPKLPLDLLPATVEDAVKISVEENPRLKATYLGTLMAQKSALEAEADGFYPSLSASAENNVKYDEGGTIGYKREQLIKVELSYSLNLGLTERNTFRAAELAAIASDNRFAETRDLTEERVRNAWDDLETAKLRADQLRNQTNIASEFLELARKERQLGNRSLIDVLAGETALINATSDAASAEIDVAQAVYRTLAAMGRLTADAVRN